MPGGRIAVSEAPAGGLVEVVGLEVGLVVRPLDFVPVSPDLGPGLVSLVGLPVVGHVLVDLELLVEGEVEGYPVVVTHLAGDAGEQAVHEAAGLVGRVLGGELHRFGHHGRGGYAGLEQQLVDRHP